MVMKIHQWFPTDFFEFRNNSLDNADLISRLESIKCEVVRSTNLSFLKSVHKSAEFVELFDWIDLCLEEIRTNLHYKCDKFQIVNSWFNKSVAGSGMHQNYHKHTMSFFSGIYYLTDGAPTVFEDPVYQRVNAQIEVLREHYVPWQTFSAEKGKLIIFPSWVYHQTLPHLEDLDRWIISFNVLPTGNINTGSHDASCFLSLGN